MSARHFGADGTLERLRDRGLKVRKVQQEMGLEPIGERIDMAPIHYQHLAIEALDRGLITEGRFANFLGVVNAEITETILERLVALNAERAAEERQPRYQTGYDRGTISMTIEPQSRQMLGRVALPKINIDRDS
jgi:hypothetical protein